jgi:predicted DsbA family dithiol-disulfide isomerase
VVAVVVAVVVTAAVAVDAAVVAVATAAVVAAVVVAAVVVVVAAVAAADVSAGSPKVEPRGIRADSRFQCSKRARPPKAGFLFLEARLQMPETLLLYTDFVCPFCFIAEQSTVPRLLAEFDLALDWHGFELHPSTPRGGLSLSRLFPGVPLSALHERTRRFAAQFGVTGFNPPDDLHNTRRALAIAELARDRGCLEPFRAAAFEAHWRLGKNLEDDGDLGAIAVVAGLPRDEALRAADDPAILARVDRKQNEARASGVTGIPTFVIAGEEVVGCQPYEVLAAAAERAGVRRRAR